MARTTRQTVVFGVEDWKRIYETFREADFQSYDFETLRKSFIDYIRQYYPESFNDYIESSEFIAMLDVIAFMGQALSFRNDLNTRENYLGTAERRDSVVKLAELVSYTPKRNQAAQGYLKVFSVQTTENVTDFNGVNLANVTINWNDPTNFNWVEQFTAVINAALVNTQRVGRPGNKQTVIGVDTSEYLCPTAFLMCCFAMINWVLPAPTQAISFISNKECCKTKTSILANALPIAQCPSTLKASTTKIVGCINWTQWAMCNSNGSTWKACMRQPQNNWPRIRENYFQQSVAPMIRLP